MRPVFLRCVGVVALSLLGIPSTFAQLIPEPLKLADGLVDNEMSDLAMEYLDKLSESKTLSKDVQRLLPLKRAEVRLALADEEDNPTKRTILLEEARSELNQFLAQNPNDPLHADASLSLARLQSVQAMADLREATNIDDNEARQSAYDKLRPVFNKAFEQYQSAVKELTERSKDKKLSKLEMRDLVNTLYDAEFEAARTKFELSNTYDTNNASPQQIVERGKVLDEASKLFDALGQKSETQPQSWQAKAWKGEILNKLDRPVDAQKVFQEVQTAVRRNPYAQAGARQIRFFEMRDAFLSAAGSENRNEKISLINKAERLAISWLNERRKANAKVSRDEFAGKWYLANLTDMQAELQIKTTKTPEGKTQRNVPDSAKIRLRNAVKLYNELARTPNAYTGRAAKKRTEAQILIIGDGKKNPNEFVAFDECNMAAQVELYQYITNSENKTEEKKKRILGLYDRLRELQPAPDDLQAAQEAKVNAVYAHILVGHPYEGAILGDHLARTLLAPDLATQAGVYGIQAYLATAANAPPELPTAPAIDQERAIALARYLESEYPSEPNTDSARILYGQLELRRENTPEAFKILSQVSPSCPQLGAARMLQGVAAYNLLRVGKSAAVKRPDGLPEDPKQLADYQADVYKQAVADLSQLGSLPADSAEEETRMAALVGLQLAELYLTNPDGGYKKAEVEAMKVAKMASDSKTISDDLRSELQLKADFTKARAIYAQAIPVFKKDNYDAVMKQIQPLLDEMDKSGLALKGEQEPAVAAAAERLDNFRRDSIIVLAMQTRIRNGDIEKAGDIFKLLKKLGGGADSVAQALGQLAKAVAPQIDKLKKENKTKEADVLIEGVGKLLDTVANDKDITPPAIFSLGRAMKEVGSYDKAIELLNRIEKPSDELLNQPVTSLDNDSRLPVLLYRNAQLELARVDRLAGDFDKAKSILTAAMGDDDDPKAKGWASDAIEFKKEVAYLAEDHAESMSDLPAATVLWKDALTRWGQMAQGYLAYLRKPTPTDLEEAANHLRIRDRVLTLYHEAFYDQTRCLLRANTHLLAGALDKLSEKYRSTAQSIYALEKANPDMASTTQSMFGELISKYPEVEAAYKEAGGKLFIEAYKADPEIE